MSDSESLQQLSQNELVLLAKELGVAHHRLSTRDELIQSLTTGEEHPDKLETLRSELKAFLQAHKAQLVLTCDQQCELHSWAKQIQCHNRYVR